MSGPDVTALCSDCPVLTYNLIISLGSVSSLLNQFYSGDQQTDRQDCSALFTGLTSGCRIFRNF